MKNIFFSFLILLLPAASPAQDVNSISLQYGLNFISRQDLLFSPMVYQDVSFKNIAVLYSNENAVRVHSAEIFYGGYDLRWHDDYTYLTGVENETLSTSPTFMTLIGMRYNYLHKMKASGKGSWAIGGISDNQINAVDNIYGSFGTFGYLGQLSISPMVRKQLLHEKHEVLLSVYFPIISWVSRSPYALNDDEYIKNNADHNGFKTVFRYIGDGNIQTVNRLLKLNLDAEYNYHFSPKWVLGGVYRFEFLRSTKPKTLTAIRNNINLKVSYQF